jgi:hypothetical protein
MRKQLLASVSAAAGLTVLAAGASPAAAWHRDRWYADNLFGCCGPFGVYGPPAVHVVPPAYAYFPRPLYRVGCCGTLYGPRGSYYTPYYSHYGYRGYFAHHQHQ